MNLKRTVLYTSFGYGAYSACNLLMGILIGRMGHSELGIYGTAVSLCNPFMVLAALNLRSLYVSQVFRDFKVENYLATRLVNFLIALVTVFFWAQYKLHGNTNLAWFTIIFMLGNVFDQTADMYFGIYQVRNRVDFLALSQTLRGILSILLFYLFVRLSHNSLYWGIAGSSLASFLMLVGFDFPVASWVETQVRGQFIWPRIVKCDYLTIVKSAFPLTLSVFMDAFALAYPIVMVAQVLGAAANSSITAYTYLISLGQIFITGVTMAIAPRLGESFNKNNEKEFKRVVNWGGLMAAVIGGGILLLTYVAGPILIHSVFRKTITVDEGLFLWIVCGGALRFGTSILGTAITSAKWVKGQFFWSLPRLLLALLITGPLVHRFGLYGAAWAMLVPTLLKLILGAFILWFVMNRWRQEKLLPSNS